MGTLALKKKNKRKVKTKRVATTTQDYCVKVVQGIRIDVSNMAQGLADRNKLGSDMGYKVSEEDSSTLKELRSIERRLDRMEDRLRTTQVVLKETAWGKKEVGSLMRPAMLLEPLPKGRKVPRGLTAGEKYRMAGG